jgi:sulfatase maturation enzyme AslB (radical SAM superfamily)
VSHSDELAGIAYTRDCLDPWNYLEMSADGDLRPCCRFRPLAQLDSGDVHTLRNNENFRDLRQSLLSGRLQSEWQGCHIRKAVTIDALKRRVAAAAKQVGEEDVLKPQPVRFFRIDINEKCNLRCDYCLVSSPYYNGVEMEDTVFERALALLNEIKPEAHVHVNGHGETTYHKRWMQMCGSIIDRGFRPFIITNLAKNYSDEEVELLSRFSRIQISLDSDDTELMRSIRKPVRVEKIFETMERIRVAAARRGPRRQPEFTFSIGVYDPSIWTLEAFVDRIFRHVSVGLTFWDLVEYEHQRLVKSLDRLDPEQKIRASEILRRISRKLDIAGVRYIFAGDFHGMAPKPGAFDFVRRRLGFAYSLARRYVFNWA